MNRKVVYLVASFVLVLIVVWVLFKSSSSKHEVRYRITDLGPGLFEGHMAFLDINDLGQILFMGFDPSTQELIRQIVEASGVRTDLSDEFKDFRPEAMNNLGEIAGELRLPGGTSHSAIWSVADGFRDLGRSLGSGTYIKSLNDAGVIVGPSGLLDSFIWSATSGVSILPKTVGVSLQLAYGINNRGDVVGWLFDRQPGKVGFLRSATGELTYLGRSSGRFISAAKGVNDRRQVVGSCSTGGIVWEVRYRFVRLARSITIGKSWFSPRERWYRAFLWEDGVMEDLNDLISSDSGWELNDARDINNRGEIVGWGMYKDNEHAFLLTPINESDDGG